MKMLWAVIRSDKVEAVARQLKDIGARGCTIYPVRGYGEQWRLYEPLFHGGHHKLEAIVEEGQVDKIVDVVTEHASTGREGDGILSILDIASVVKVRSKERIN